MSEEISPSFAGVPRKVRGRRHGPLEDYPEEAFGYHPAQNAIKQTLNFDRVDGEISKVYGVALVWSF